MSAAEVIEFRKKNQITIPKTLSAALNIVEGDKLELHIEDGKIVITPAVIIPKEQAWFWSQEWQRGEKAVQEELIAKGPGKAYTSAELLAELTDA